MSLWSKIKKAAKKVQKAASVVTNPIRDTVVKATSGIPGIGDAVKSVSNISLSQTLDDPKGVIVKVGKAAAVAGASVAGGPLAGGVVGGMLAGKKSSTKAKSVAQAAIVPKSIAATPVAASKALGFDVGEAEPKVGVKLELGGLVRFR